MTSLGSSVHLQRHTGCWRNSCQSKFWTRFSCSTAFTQKAVAYQRSVKDRITQRFRTDFARSYWTLKNNYSDLEETSGHSPAKRSYLLNHRQMYQQTPSTNINKIERRWEDLFHTNGRYQSLDGLGQRFFDFSVMSYNILSQKLLHDNAHLYKHCSLPILKWNYRLRNMMKEIQRHNADILCLQEVQEDHYETQVKPSLESLGYHCEYKKRTGNKVDGCAVVFKQASFSLVSCHPVEYFKPDIPLLDRDNVGLVLLLKPKLEKGISNHLCVANTHLLYNPRRGDIKLTQLGLLLAEISHVSKQADGSTCPVILCGDFNAVPWSPLYRFIRERKLEYHGIPVGKVSGQDEKRKGQRILNVPLWPQCLGISQQCQYEDPSTSAIRSDEGSKINRSSIEHSLNLSSAYSHHSSKRGRPEITTCHSRRAMTVDYIFYSPTSLNSESEGLQLLARLALFDEIDLHAISGLPNANNSSDHLPLLASFRMPNLHASYAHVQGSEEHST
ncbi:protein angel homolog 2 isoform X2 [Sardina pilchardus]|uniref:protein angel homolog 2 isoform X2 n=1 Tax=Sardina pilchardus TaxID=27697 RepID=UPI002E0F6155